MFPRSRLPFFHSLQAQPVYSAFRKLNRVLRDEENAWHLLLLALHVLYEAWHEVPPLSVAERKALERNVRSLRAVARSLRARSLEIEDSPEAAEFERMANRLEGIVFHAAEAIYGLKSSRGRRFDPRDAIPVFELGSLFRQRLSGTGFYPVIADLMNALPARPFKYNVGSVRKRLAQLRGIGFQPRVQFVVEDGDVVALKFRDSTLPGPVRVSR